MPPAPAAKKKHRKWPWILLAVVVVFVIIGVSTSGSKSGNNTTAEPAAPSSAVAASVAPTIGTSVRDGKFEFVVTKVGAGVPSIGTDVIGTKAQGKFVLIDVTIKNIGDQPQTFFGSSTKAFDGAGKQYAPDDSAAIYLPDSNSFITPVNPGNTVTGTLVFDVPKEASLTSIELHDSAFSDGVTVGL